MGDKEKVKKQREICSIIIRFRSDFNLSELEYTMVCKMMDKREVFKDWHFAILKCFLNRKK